MKTTRLNLDVVVYIMAVKNTQHRLQQSVLPTGTNFHRTTTQKWPRNNNLSGTKKISGLISHTFNNKKMDEKWRRTL
jgi:hypothetical protein